MISGQKKIFVVYSTRDLYVNEKSLLRIYKDLQKFGKVFIDIIHNKSVNKQKYVLKKLDESSHIVIVDSPKIKESEWAQLEIKIAKSQNKEILGYYKPVFIKDKIEFEFTETQFSNGLNFD